MSIPDRGVWDKDEAESEGGEVGSSEEKGKWHRSGEYARLFRDPLTWAALLLACSLCFGLGLIAARESRGSDELWIEQLPDSVLSGNASSSRGAAGEGMGTSTTAPAQAAEGISTQPAAAGAALPSKSGAYTASKNGTKYYLPNCAGAKRIKEENKVWFATKAEAEAAGYGPASTCKGL